MNKTLFISVDGDQIYLDSLFLPILAPLNNKNRKIDILQFCLDDVNLRDRLSKAVQSKNMHIIFEDYFNKPPVIGSFLFILVGAIKLFKIMKKNDYTTLMPRSLVAAAMVLLIIPFFKEMKIVYESDGLVADERVDFGGWSKKGLIYKLFRWIEKKIIEKATIVTTRTNKAKDIYLKRTSKFYENKIITIPNGKIIEDIETTEQINIKQKIKKELSFKNNDIVFIYVGTIGPQYEPKKMLEIFKFLNSKLDNSKLIILTPNIETINKEISNFPEIVNHVVVKSVKPDEVKEYILASDIGLSLRTPTFSQQGICPLKLIEYLMMGIPTITNKGVGDLDELFGKYDIGYIIEDLNHINFKEILSFVSNSKLDSENLKKIAKTEFDLEIVIDKYNKVFERVENE